MSLSEEQQSISFFTRITVFRPNDHLFLLADPVSPRLCLQVILRVPVRVKDDNGVC